MRRITLTFTLIFLGLLALDTWPGLRGGAGWRWPYAAPEHPAAVIALALVIIAYIAGVIVLRHRNASARLTLAWIVLGGTALGFAAAGIQSGDSLSTLFTRTVSPVQTGASTVAVREMAANGVGVTLETWLDVMRGALDANIIHFTTSPPGQPLIHYAAAQLTHALPGADSLSMALRSYQCSNMAVMSYTRGELVSAAMVGMLMPLWAALAALPLYYAAAMLTGDRRAGVRIAAWWPLVPSVLLFAPTWNTLYPALGVLSFALLLAGDSYPHPQRFPHSMEEDRTTHSGRGSPSPTDWGGVKRRPFMIVMAGMVMSIASFLNFAVAPLLLLFATFVLGRDVRDARNAREQYGRPTRSPLRRLPLQGLAHAIITSVWFGIGLLSVWIIYWFATGLTPLDLASVTADMHSDLVANRDYAAWLLLHPYDVLMFTGWPLVALFGWTIWGSGAQPGRSPLQAVLAAATLLTIILVDLVGVVQGENARIMSYYAPFFLLVAAGLLAQRSRHWDVPLLAAQGVTVLVMASVLPVVPLDLNPPPSAPRSDVPTLDHLEPLPANATFTSTDYAGRFSLVSYRFVADLGAQVITLETIWGGGAQVERPYEFEVMARAQNDIDGHIVAGPQSWQAQNGNYLPTCWQTGDAIHDVVLIDLPPVSAPVAWMLELRAIDPRTGDTLRVTLPDGATADHATLGPVSYP